MGSAKDRIFMLGDFAGKGIISEYYENGQKNAEAEKQRMAVTVISNRICNKLILGEVCSIRAANLFLLPS